MLGFEGRTIHLVCGVTDMRKSIDGLTVVIQHQLARDPMASAVFVFCNRYRNRLKIIEWDSDGFWMYFKRLERGHFNWPAVEDGEALMELSSEEMELLLSGTKLVQKIQRSRLSEMSVG